MKKQKTVTVSAFFIILLSTTLIIIFAMQPKQTESPQELKTYFTYSAEEISRIRKSPPINKAAVANLNELDKAMLNDVASNGSQPTVAARYYAYMLTAQHDAYALSAFTNKGFGSIETTSRKIACVFFPERCQLVRNPNATENLIAEIIMTKVWQRYDEDTRQTQVAVKDMQPGPDIWYFYDVITPEAGAWKTWQISTPKDFLAPPPPVKGSTEDKQQIKAVEEALKNNTPDLIAKVKYWAAGGNTVTPSGMWLKFANEYMDTHQIPLEKRMEIRSLLSQTMADSFISCWYTKYVYWVERPFMRSTAIKPVIQTPNFPSYTSGHSTVSAAAATILSHYFPENKDTWFSMATEARNSRLWAGIHFPIDNEEGFKMGEKIGGKVLETNP